MAIKTEEGLNKIVYKAKKVFVKDEIIAENNINNTTDCSLKDRTETHESNPSNSIDNTIKNEVPNEEKNSSLNDLKGEQK